MSVQASRSTSVEIWETAVRSSGVTKTHQTGTPKEAWQIVALLFLFMLINFADKAVIGIATVPIMEELQLSPRQFGLIGSSFFLLFSALASMSAPPYRPCRPAHGTEVVGWVGEVWNGPRPTPQTPHKCVLPRDR